MDSNGRRSREVTEGRLLGLADDSLKFIFKDSHQTEPMICVNKQQSTEDKLPETPPTDESPSFRHKKKAMRQLIALWRKEGDSNPRNPFGVYSLSRRASSTTPASFQIAGAKIETFAQFRNYFKYLLWR